MTDTKKDSAKRPCVYMLRCKGGSLYTGWTNDFEKRLAAHQSGKGAKYTRSHLPVEPAYLEYLPDKIAATRREAEIKKLAAEKKRELLKSERNKLCRRNGRLLNDSKPPVSEEQK